MERNLISTSSLGQVLSSRFPRRLSQEEINAEIEALRARGTYTCRVCGLVVIGKVADPPVCAECIDADRDRELERQRVRDLADLQKAKALERVGCPEKYRGVFDPDICEYRDEDGEHLGWPRDRRTGGLSLENWRGQPHFVTLLGGNGAGKSGLAAELLYRLHSQGLVDCAWIRPAQIHREDRESSLGVERPLRSRAESAEVLVLDELGHSCPVEAVAEVIEARWSAERITIFTTHRLLKGKGSIADEAPMIYDRLRDGGVYRLTGKSKRGQR